MYHWEQKLWFQANRSLRASVLFLPLWSLFLRHNYYSQSEGIQESKRGSSACSAKEPFWAQGGHFNPGNMPQRSAWAVPDLALPCKAASPRAQLTSASGDLQSRFTSGYWDLSTMSYPQFGYSYSSTPQVSTRTTWLCFGFYLPREILLFFIFLWGIDVPFLLKPIDLGTYYVFYVWTAILV